MTCVSADRTSWCAGNVWMRFGLKFADGLDASEDYDLCLRLAEVTKLAVLEEPLYLYRKHPQSASRIQEQRQALNKAVALERAIYRRFGPAPAVDRFAIVGRDFLRAAIIGFLRDDRRTAQDSIDRALNVYPPLLDSDRPLETLVRAYTPMQSMDVALKFTESIFDELFPKTIRLSLLKSRLLSYLHMGRCSRP